MVACLGIFGCFFFMIMVYYLRNSLRLEQVDWDVSIVTAGDYSVDMKITQQQYSYFRDHHLADYREDSTGYAFKKHLKMELEEKLTNEVAS